jgi:ribosomal protein S18 acetylase RimI-like enzyme
MTSPELSEHRAIEFTPAQLADAMNVCFEGYIMTFTLDAATFERRFRPEGLDTISSVIMKSGDDFAAICLIARQGWTSRVAAMAIAPNFRRMGVGQRLMQKVISEARERGDKRMVLEVIEQNPPAIALYESVGMSKIHRLAGYRREPSEGLAADLVRVDPSVVIRAQVMECPADLPWDFKAETLTLKMGILKGFSLGDEAFALISDPPGQRVIIWSLFTRKGSRRSGFGRRMVEALAALYPDAALVTSVALPDDYCPEFLSALGFAEVSISQFEMAIDLTQ